MKFVQKDMPLQLVNFVEDNAGNWGKAELFRDHQDNVVGLRYVDNQSGTVALAFPMTVSDDTSRADVMMIIEDGLDGVPQYTTMTERLRYAVATLHNDEYVLYNDVRANMVLGMVVQSIATVQHDMIIERHWFSVTNDWKNELVIKLNIDDKRGNSFSSELLPMDLVLHPHNFNSETLNTANYEHQSLGMRA